MWATRAFYTYPGKYKVNALTTPNRQKYLYDLSIQNTLKALKILVIIAILKKEKGHGQKPLLCQYNCTRTNLSDKS